MILCFVHPLLMLAQVFVDKAVRHVLLRQGVLGLQVKIMLPFDPTGKAGINHNLPDIVCAPLSPVERH